VTKTHVVWTGRARSRFESPIVHKGRMYFIAGGIVKCIDAKTGKNVFQSRLQGGSSGSQGGGRRRRGHGGGDYSSPVLADGKIYYVKGSGDTYVLKISEKFEQLAVNRVTDDRETFGATPAISNGRLYIRSNKYLYCVAEQ